jgi:hypothetical protein
MIFSRRGSCSPRSLGRRRVKVGVRVRVVVVVIGVGIVLLVVVLVLILLLRVLLGAPWRTIIKRHLVIGGDVLLGGLVG